MRLQHKSLFAVPLLMATLAACDPGSQAMLAGASLVTFVHTDKTIGDHVATWAFDKDCSTLSLANGEGYCHETMTEEQRKAAEAEAAAQRAGTYCYRTLGAINCFRQPDTMASSAARVR
ncbi:hypothetical protein AAFN88_12230 [Pelagibius sp. CAU 1746]|uniref:hypothetical protein n=1 Tax=Pelagibius sp. CAU 1746 TaxID=3140370 RepID=UPI00325BEEFC